MKNIILLFILYFAFFDAGAQTARSYTDAQLSKGTLAFISPDLSSNSVDKLAVYPNPVVDLLKISFRSSQQSKTVISLFNNIGKPVLIRESLVEAGNNIITVDVRDEAINPGIYFVQIVVEKEVFTRKLIIK